VHFKVPHGIGGGMFLLDVSRHNVSRGYYDYSELHELVEPTIDLSARERSERLILLFEELFGRLNVPTYLNQWGISQDNIKEAAKLMLPLQAAFDQNPVPFSAGDDALEFLKRHVA
jgi:alcohol dehydrogenase class IV